MNIALLSGRYFTEQDNEQAVKVAIINESMANRFWPHKDALGKHLVLDVPPQKFSGEIVGIVSDVKHRGLDARSGSEVYVPYFQNPSRDMSLVVRTAPGNPASLTGSIRNSVMAVDKHQMLYNVKTMDQVINESVSGLRFSMFLLGVFAFIALVLAAVGIYGVMAYSVRQRTHEIGIRMALGAEASSILKLIIRQGMILVAAGVGMGLVAAFLLMRVMASLLFGVSATDPTIFAAVTLLLVLVALVACCLPARKAAKVDPIIALRYE
jgi:putative ABC transport system permease protein